MVAFFFFSSDGDIAIHDMEETGCKAISGALTIHVVIQYKINTITTIKDI